MSGGAATLKIGRRDPGNLYFQGLVDDVRIYDVTLNHYEVQQGMLGY
jgi:hypothetical protein